MGRVARRLSSPVFVGRGEQLEALRVALSRADAGEPGAVFIGGESGVGKTRLVMEFERIVRAAGARFLVGACVDVGGSELPYAPLLGALRALVGDVEDRALEDMVSVAAGELGRLLPELAVGPVARVSGGSSDALDPLAQSRLFEGLLGLFGRAGRDAPVVLVIEDLHWADPSTRGFLSFLLRNIRRERLLLVATYRSDELHRRHPLRQFLAEVERLPVVERLAVAPFTRPELA
ncbi:MAG TPA: ATP-binding protein, partial [Mycobacterium sp.]|nr:ATP-binding protein [Mycobacterium sp.]